MQNSSINITTWLEQQIHLIITQINSTPDDEELLSRLDKFISMKKKYDNTVDYYGETLRVMENFVTYIITHQQHDAIHLQGIIQEFLNSQTSKRI